MKQTIKNYSFDKTAKTVTFSDFGSISLDRLFLITNVTSNTIIYQFNDSSLGGTVAGNVLTLTYNTGSMANTDKLQIIYDAASGDPTYDATGTTFVVGNVASGASDNGNPVKVGGIYNATPPSFTDGQRGDLQVGSKGSLRTELFVSGSTQAAAYVTTNADGQAVGSLGVRLETVNRNTIFNGTSFDRLYSASAATGTTGLGVPAAGAMGIYNSTPPTVTSGNYERLQLDSSGNLKINIAAGSAGGTQYTNGSAQATPTGTVALGYDGANVRAVKTAADGTQLVQGGFAEQASLSTASTTNNDLVASTDVSAYKFFSLQLTGTWTGTINVQGSNDNSTWVTVGVYIPQGNNILVNSISGNNIYVGYIYSRYMRVRVVTGGTGTVTGTLELATLPPASLVANAQQGGTWSVGANSATGSAAPANAFYMAGINSSGNLSGLATIDRPSDAATGNAVLATGGYIYNGTNFDRARSATSVAGTTGTGLTGAGILGFDGTNYQRVKTDTSGNVSVVLQASTSGGMTTYRNLDVQSTGVNVKSSAGKVYGWFIANNSSSIRYVKLYNKATAPTVGTDTPLITLPIPANAASNVEFSNGLAFSTGIGIGGVTGVADNNTGAPTANDIICNLFYS